MSLYLASHLTIILGLIGGVAVFLLYRYTKDKIDAENQKEIERLVSEAKEYVKNDIFEGDVQRIDHEYYANNSHIIYVISQDIRYRVMLDRNEDNSYDYNLTKFTYDDGELEQTKIKWKGVR